MNRRDFLKSVFGIGAAAFVPVGLFKLLEDKPTATPVRQDITVLPAESKELRLGWVVYEEVGFAVVNDRAIRRLQSGKKPRRSRLDSSKAVPF